MSNAPPNKPDREDSDKQPLPATPAPDDGSSAGGNEQLGGKSHGLFRSAKTWLEVVLLLFGLVAVPLAIKTWLESEVEKSVAKTLNDEPTLRKIASRSRPSLIFNAKESVVADMGAVQYIDPKDIRITKRTTGGWPQRIHIGFVRPLSIPPVLTSLYDSAEIRAERAKALDWEFEVSWSVEPLSKDDKDRLYRLEIIVP
jgi:hypothetical protein